MVTLALLLLAMLWMAVSLLRRRVPPLPGEMGRITEKLPLIPAGLILGLFTAVIAALLHIGGNVQALPVAVFTLLGAALVHLGCMPCLRWNEDGFVCRSALGLTRRYTWQDEMWLTQDALDYALHTRHGRIALTRSRPECAAFLREIKARRPLPLRTVNDLNRRT